MKKDEKKKAVPLGTLSVLTDDDLDRLSQVTPFDIEKAKIKWRERAPKKYKNLLDAKTDADVKDANANPQ